MSIMERVQNALRGARTYRFEGEQQNHAQQLAETQAAIAGWESTAAADMTPEQQHWLNHHRAGMEDRLAVFEGKPRLTVEEMNERDAIETHLYGAPLARAGRNVLVAREDGGTGVRGFLGPLAAHPAVALLLSPWTWLVISLGLLGLQTGRIGNLQDDARDLRADLAMSERNAADLASTNARLTAEVNNANHDASQTAATIEAERARRLRAEREARRIRNEMDQARAGGSVDYGFGGMRNDGPPATGAPGGDPAGGNPG